MTSETTVQTAGQMNGSTEPMLTASYADPTYWDGRFRTEENYEWCGDYTQFRHLVAPDVMAGAKVLEVGAGNSSLAAALSADCCSSVTATDLSPVVIDAMRQRCSSGKVSFEVADMLQLPFQTSFFDVVIEKGAMDVFEAAAPSRIQPPPHVVSHMTAALEQAHRVLRPGGVFLSVTFAQPHFRMPYLTLPQFTWSADVSNFGGEGMLEYFVYRCVKGARSSSAVVPRFGSTTSWHRKTDDPTPYHEHMDDENFLANSFWED